MRVIFMGTPDFSVPVLDALIKAGHDIAAVYCQPPRPAGRGKKDRASPVQVRAEALGLTVRYPVTLRGADVQREFAALNADIAVVVAYGLILPQAVLDAPRLGCLNIHASLLPRWRGAAPIHRAIMAGDAVSGVCIMQMDAGLDTGAVLMRREIGIGPTETTGTLHDRLSDMGAALIVEALDTLAGLVAVAQSDVGVSYAAKIEKSEARVVWTRSAIEVDRHIRGLSPFPGAWCEIKGERVKLLASQTCEGQGQPGVVLDDAFAIACGVGAVRVTRLQRAGKAAQDVSEVLRGWPVAIGTRL